jgi:dynein intermediate chain
MASLQARRDEILAKKAKLAELKARKELREREASASRQSTGSISDVCQFPLSYEHDTNKF